MRVKWETIVGVKYEGEVIRVENDGDGMMVDVRLDDGTVRSVESDCLQEAK